MRFRIMVSEDLARSGHGMECLLCVLVSAEIYAFGWCLGVGIGAGVGVVGDDAWASRLVVVE